MADRDTLDRTMDDESEGQMTVEEAGRKGGEETKKRHGPEFYEEIGRKGGEKRAEELGHEGYSEIGRKGGQKVKKLIEDAKRGDEGGTDAADDE